MARRFRSLPIGRKGHVADIVEEGGRSQVVRLVG
jgi:hypothetical protein